MAFHEIWNTSGAPAPIAAAEDEPTRRELSVPPPPHGTKMRINEFAPGHLDEAGLQSPVHLTESVDYGIVPEGEFTLVLDDSEVTLHPVTSSSNAAPPTPGSTGARRPRRSSSCSSTELSLSPCWTRCRPERSTD